VAKEKKAAFLEEVESERGIPDSEMVKADEIEIPVVKFREATVREGVRFLQLKSRELAWDKKPLNLICSLPADEKMLEPRITLTLEKYSLYDAFRELALEAGLDVHLLPHVLLMGNPPAPPIANGDSPLVKKAESIVVNSIDMRYVPVAVALKLLREETLAADPEKIGIKIDLSPGTDPDVKVIMWANEIPLMEALRCVAGLANLDLREEPGGFVLGPRKAGKNAGGAPSQ
jgi:hypothetical protein